MPNLFSTLFAFPRIDCEIISSAKLTSLELDKSFIYTRIGGRNFDLLPSFVAELDSVRRFLNVLLENNELRDAASNTVLVSQVWVDYSQFVNQVFETYSTGFPLRAISSNHTDTLRRTVVG